MAPNKTKPTQIRPASYLAAIEDAARREDCAAIVQLMARVTGHPAVMWGTGIVGFGSYHYRYDSGREGDSCQTGFAARKGDISIYLMADFPQRDALLAQLGKHKMGKACLYIRKLSDIDTGVLEQLVLGSVAQVRRTYGA